MPKPTLSKVQAKRLHKELKTYATFQGQHQPHPRMLNKQIIIWIHSLAYLKRDQREVGWWLDHRDRKIVWTRKCWGEVFFRGSISKALVWLETQS